MKTARFFLLSFCYLLLTLEVQGQAQSNKMIVLLNGVATEAIVSLPDGQILEVIREIPNYFPSHYKSYTLKEILAQSPAFLKDDDYDLIVLETPSEQAIKQPKVTQTRVSPAEVAQHNLLDNRPEVQSQTDLSLIDFDPKNAALSDMAIQELDKTIAQMKADPSFIANIQYTTGGPKYMQELISRRAHAIKKYMQLRHISTSRITLEETIGSAQSSVAVKLVRIIR